ncbi:uncharacterized protein LOC142236081 [Haematobia irritans]|uniref:uncharacterized protein LOC142236081 n=1 Tax=Haematobia irritans TaxID=7368 RepID=UPI003F4F50E4
MFKFAPIVFALIACVSAKPGLFGTPLAYTAPAAVVAAAPAPFVTATSSQVVARNYNGIATAPIVAPVAAPIVTKAFAPAATPFATPVVAKTFAAPLAAAAYTTPVVAKYAAGTPLAYTSPLAYTTPLAYTAPVTYAAAPRPIVW